MEINYPVWLPKTFGSQQSAEEMNGIVEVLQNHAENLSLQQKQILTSAGGIYPGKVIPTSPFPEGISQAVFLVGPGTYPNYGNKTIPANNLGLIFFYNSTFDLVTIEIPVYDDTSIQNKVTNIENRTTALEGKNQVVEDNVNTLENELSITKGNVTALENKNGGDVEFGNTKNVEGRKVFDYVNNKSITKFDPTAYEGGYPKDALVIHENTIYASKVSSNKETPSEAALNWTEVKMSADVDQEFDENSDNAIANKKVSKLAKVLDGFYDIPTEGSEELLVKITKDSSSIPINGVTPLIGSNVLRSNNKTVAFPGLDNIIYLNIPIKQASTIISKITFNSIRTGGGILNENANLLGIKSDGSIDVLIGSISTTPSLIIEHLQFDLSNYKSFSFMISFNPNGSNNDNYIDFFELNKYYKDVKSYIYESINITKNELLNKIDSTAIQSISDENNLIIDLDNNKTVYVPDSKSLINILPNNVAIIDSINIYIDITTTTMEITNNNIVWQKNESPKFSIGYSYFILLNTFNGGVSYIGSVIGFWETKNKLKYYNDFNSDQLLPAITTQGDLFKVENKKLTLKTKVNKFPLFVFDTISSFNFNIEIEVDDIYVNDVMIVNNIKDEFKTFNVFGFSNSTIGKRQTFYYGYVLNNVMYAGSFFNATVMEGKNIIRIEKLNDKNNIYVNNFFIGYYIDGNGTSRTTVGFCIRNLEGKVNSVKIY